MNRLNGIMRRMAPIFAAGVVFQTTGCTFDTATLTGGLLTYVVNSVVSSFVFSAFNLAP